MAVRRAPRRREVFLSHSAKDRDFVVRLAGMLARHGIHYWYSATHISGARKWHDAIGRALARCDWFVIVLTPNSVRSSWVKREFLFALNDVRYNERIIPLFLRPCDYASLSWTLSQIQFVDFRNSFEQGCRQLMKIWKVKYRTRSH
jgi:TIR domain